MAAPSFSSTREIGERSNTWNWEKRGAGTGPDPDRFWTRQRVGKFGKPGACKDCQVALKGTFLKTQSQLLRRDLMHPAARPAKREEWGHTLLPCRVPHRLLKWGQQGLGEVAALPKDFIQ